MCVCMCDAGCTGSVAERPEERLCSKITSALPGCSSLSVVRACVRSLGVSGSVCRHHLGRISGAGADRTERRSSFNLLGALSPSRKVNASARTALPPRTADSGGGRWRSIIDGSWFAGRLLFAWGGGVRPSFIPTRPLS